MRLGQLARQLDIKPEKIVSFLEKEKNFTIKSHPNCKVNDEFIEDISNYFTPTVKEKVVTKATQKKEVEPVEKPTEAIETPLPIKCLDNQEVAMRQELKIIGKIDLPNKKEVTVEVDGVVYDQATLDEKKKEELKIERERKALEKEAKKKEEAEKRRLAKEKRDIEAERQAMLVTEKSNLLSKEAERKKAIILKAQKEREKRLEKKRKAKQAKHYKTKFSAKATAKNKTTKVNTPITEPNPKPKTEQLIVEIQEKSLFKRFIKWLNT